VPDCVHAAMNAMKAARLNPAEPAPLVDASRIELVNGDDTVLARSQASNTAVGIVVGALPTHVGG
jgi:hypothetical protein